MSKRWFIVLLILIVAAVFRFQHIGSVPPGLYPDEAMNGNNALAALETGPPAGGYKVFYPENNGREGLFIALQAQSIKFLGNQPWALRLVSAIFGVLTVLGTYFLAAKLFNWQIGALSSFLLAISFWHTLFSRIGFRAIMAPFFLVWGLYFLWRGLQGGRLINFAVSGILWGLGFYTYIAFRAMPLVLILVLLAYWAAVHKDFSHEKYVFTRDQMTRGLALLLVVFILTFLPLGWYFYNHPADFFGRTGQLSIFASGEILKNFLANTVTTLGMFNFVGDWNWRHNLAGQPLLFWPIGVFFAAGFLRAWFKLWRAYKKHGHFSTVQTLLLSWFLVGLLPVIFSNEGLPHALRAIIVAPVVFIFAGEGLWWVYDMTRDWAFQPRYWLGVKPSPAAISGSAIALLAVLIILTISAYAEYDKYFNRWATSPNVADAFAQNYLELGQRLNGMPTNIKKYVLVNTGGVLVNNIPMPAQTVMFITDTYAADKQTAQNIYYLTEEQFRKGQYDHRGVILPLE